MVSLAKTVNRFEIPMRIIQGGSGDFTADVREASQDTYGAYIFTPPRRIMRVRKSSRIVPGLVVETPNGEKFILGDNGGADLVEGTIWNSFKMFKATEKVLWERRGRRRDPVTRLEIEGELEEMGNIWVAIEPMTREGIERNMHVRIAQSNFIAGADVQTDDVLDGRPVTLCNPTLGIRTGILS